MIIGKKRQSEQIMKEISKEQKARSDAFNKEFHELQIKHKVVANVILNFQTTGIFPTLQIRDMTREEIEQIKKTLIHKP